MKEAEMTPPETYEIVETRYSPRGKTTLDFKGTFEEAKQKATEMAKQNIGVRYAVFCEGSPVADFQAFFRTVVKCPRCGTRIPIE
jgi:hypothetical protein